MGGIIRRRKPAPPPPPGLLLDELAVEAPPAPAITKYCTSNVNVLSLFPVIVHVAIL